jgi:hypothetical protein
LQKVAALTFSHNASNIAASCILLVFLTAPSAPGQPCPYNCDQATSDTTYYWYNDFCNIVFDTSALIFTWYKAICARMTLVVIHACDFILTTKAAI